MKILIISDEVWNDEIHGNNVLTNWFEGFDGDFANIFCSPGMPKNNCCRKYFQITDSQMIRSIFKHKPAGNEIEYNPVKINNYNSTDVNNIEWFRNHAGGLVRFLKNTVWTIGKYDNKKLEKFIKAFNPDVIFSARFANPKILRLEKEVKKYTDCPIIAFTGDNEYSLRMFSVSLFDWINKFWNRYLLNKNKNFYSVYYTLSDEQKKEYEKIFTCPVKILRKCYDLNKEIKTTDLHNPIKLIYAGKLYCNRWKTLAAIGKALSVINKDDIKVQLHIYTKDKLSKKQLKALNYLDSVFLHGSISQNEVFNKYKDSDIALHVESFDLSYKLETRLSFSTKIIDCLVSGCGVMCIAWEEHSGLTYLKKEDAAVCINNYKDILPVLNDLTKNTQIINEYKQKAIDCLIRNHLKNRIQQNLLLDFNNIIK